MAHENPVAKPSLQRRGCPSLAGQGLPRPRWNRSVAVARHPADTLEEGQAKVVVRQERKQVAERGQHGEAGAPAVAVPRREDDGVAHQASRIDALADQSEHRFGDDEPDVVLHPLPQAVSPVGVTVGVARARGHPHLAVAHLDVGRGDVVGPRIEGPAGDEVEAGVMPVAGENAVGDRAPMQRKSQVRTAIVERVDPTVVQTTRIGQRSPLTTIIRFACSSSRLATRAKRRSLWLPTERSMTCMPNCPKRAARGLTANMVMPRRRR